VEIIMEIVAMGTVDMETAGTGTVAMEIITTEIVDTEDMAVRLSITLELNEYMILLSHFLHSQSILLSHSLGGGGYGGQGGYYQGQQGGGNFGNSAW